MRNKTCIIISIFLAVVFIIGPAAIVFAADKKAVASPNISSLLLLDKPSATVSEDEKVIISPNIRYSAENLRDPFMRRQEEKVIEAPEVNPAATPPALVVKGIIWGSDLAQAIINDKVVKIGDTIEGAEIIGITKEGVEFNFGGMVYNLSSPAVTESQSIKKDTQR